jgi:hypothetical protein
MLPPGNLAVIFYYPASTRLDFPQSSVLSAEVVPQFHRMYLRSWPPAARSENELGVCDRFRPWCRCGGAGSSEPGAVGIIMSF